MKITFFGSSHGFPEPHRRCSSTLIEIGENRYFIYIDANTGNEIAILNAKNR
jgi:ribonuclease BN (tRNA processing enzyme)